MADLGSFGADGSGVPAVCDGASDGVPGPVDVVSLGDGPDGPGDSVPMETVSEDGARADATPATAGVPGGFHTVRFDAKNKVDGAHALRGTSREAIRAFRGYPVVDNLMHLRKGGPPGELLIAMATALATCAPLAASPTATLQLCSQMTSTVAAIHASAVRTMKKQRSDDRKKAAVSRAVAALAKAEAATDPSSRTESDLKHLSTLRARVVDARAAVN